MPTDPLTARPVFEAYFRHKELTSAIVVAPDAGRARSATRFAEKLGLPVAIGNKTRINDREVALTSLAGDLAGARQAIIYDDEIAAGTSVEAMGGLLYEYGIRRMCVVCTHGVLTGDALARLSALPYLEEIVTSDTVPIADAKRTAKLTVLSVAPIFAEAIRRNYLRQSIGDLFAFWEEFNPED
jgi:ribose-phosphate pyrophosphokinase